MVLISSTILTLLFAGTHATSPPASPLLSLLPSSSPPPSACAGAEILTCTQATVNWSSLQTNTSIILPTGDILQIEQKTGHGLDRSWGGKGSEPQTVIFGNPDGSRVVLTHHAGTMYGTVGLADGRDFRIESIDNSSDVVWAELDQGVWEDEHELVDENPHEEELPHMRMTELLALGRADHTTVVEYTVTVYYTKGFKETTADPTTFIDQVIAETNDGYKNSGIPLRAKLHCVLESDVPDGLSSGLTVRLFTIGQKSLNLVRKSADVAVLLVKNYSKSNSCGVNWFNSFRIGQTLGTVRKACALGYFSFGHEIAHGFGLAHDRRVASYSSTPFAYGNIIAVSI
jgi:hypothetical protein